jgi:hypothetical protein
MADRANTHVVEFGLSVVVKRYRSWDQDRHGREWRALTLLDEYAPGLAPEPLRAELDADPPAIEMSRLDGVPLTAPVTAGQTAALADAVETLQRAIPPEILLGLPSRLLHPKDALRNLRAWCARRPPPEAFDPEALLSVRADRGGEHAARRLPAAARAVLVPGRAVRGPGRSAQSARHRRTPGRAPAGAPGIEPRRNDRAGPAATRSRPFAVRARRAGTMDDTCGRRDAMAAAETPTVFHTIPTGIRL